MLGPRERAATCSGAKTDDSGAFACARAHAPNDATSECRHRRPLPTRCAGCWLHGGTCTRCRSTRSGRKCCNPQWLACRRRAALQASWWPSRCCAHCAAHVLMMSRAERRARPRAARARSFSRASASFRARPLATARTPRRTPRRTARCATFAAPGAPARHAPASHAASLRLTRHQDAELYVTCGSVIKLQHASTKYRLHSHEGAVGEASVRNAA